MKLTIKMLVPLFAVALSFPAVAQQYLPSGARWLEHLNNDLIPFWTAESSFGEPIGAFPSIRCDDRTLYDEQKACPEIARDPSATHWRYLVALSRQSFGYGVAFHLTGNRAYLDAMKAGIDFIRQDAMDRVNGGMATAENIQTGSWGPAPNLRNPQELAYGLLGMAFYYYLTRDGDVLHDIVAVKRYIFEKYGTAPGAILWQPTHMDAPSGDKELVAQLDQMNTYLVLLTPMLPEPIQTEWKGVLLQLSNVMIDQYYSAPDKLFFQLANNSEDKVLAKTGTDFGHTAKALWMIRFAGLITGANNLVTFAQYSARALLERAYLKDCGCWAGGIQPGGTLDLNKVWWTYAELDQLAGTLALRDPEYIKYLPRSYDYWFDRFVDKQFGEVWNGVDGATNAPVRQRPKQWQWKNAYHSFEHALVGYIVAQQLQSNPVTLYYAFPGDTLPDHVFRYNPKH